MTNRIFQVDSFTNKPFKGNPAGVCVLPEAVEESWMQSVANEMNVAETAFLFPENDGYHLRWFTPETEVKLCGHATLASAHILWSENIVKEHKAVKFFTKSGVLAAEKKSDWITLDFPALMTENAPISPILNSALGLEAKEVFKNPTGYLIAELPAEKDVRDLKPNFNKLLEVDSDLIIVTAKAETAEFDFVSRVFVSKYGINEDPVTGAAHSCLAPYWGKKLNRADFTAYQASKRGGVVKLQWNQDRVKLIGQAVTVLKCELFS